jgi:MoxR-like ATPase
MTDPGLPSAPPGAADMVEFRCPQCQRLLRISATAAGKVARCPGCGGQMTVPMTSAALATMTQPPTQPLMPPGYSQPAMPPSLAMPQPSATPSPARLPVAPTTNGPANSATPQIDAGFRLQPLDGFGGNAPAMAPAPNVQAVAPSAPAAFAMASEGAARTANSPAQILFNRITAEVRKVFVGQEELVLGTLVALFSSGHVLIESVPGLGKTLFVRTLGRVLGCGFGRIQFTADLMPSDITGTPIFDLKSQEFRFYPGPVFTQLLLADEINRAPAKTHAALLEIMQEYRVTIERTSHKLDRPFLVLATQNPIESEGTYNLPEAQLDRFMFKLAADYPSVTEEAAVLKLHSQQRDLDLRLAEDLKTVTSPEEIMAMTRSCGEVRVDDKLIDYINTLVRRTRGWPQFHLGASPRAGIALVQAARTLAAFSGRDYAVPDDVVQIALPALRHRVILTAEADVEGQRVDDQLRELIRTIEVPRL